MREERIAVFPGSFDPVTLGHMDIIERAAQLFDRVYVAIVPNGEKTHPMFTDEEKLELMRVSVAPLGNVEAALWNGLLTDFAAQKGARFLVRGARNSMDSVSYTHLQTELFLFHNIHSLLKFLL